MNDPSLSSHQRNASDDVYLAAMRRFVARVGHSRVPSGFVEDVDGDKIDLGAWVADIRTRHARASLDGGLTAALETAAPDWSWDAWEVSFRTHVAALHQFAGREGHVNVPPFHEETIDGQRLGLGYWVSARHHEHRRHELPANRVAALEAVMGWEWEYSPESLDAETETTALPTSALYPSGLDRLSLRALRLFADREGHADVPESHVEVFDVFSISLGAWVNELHVAYSRDELTDEQVIVLEAVPGWLWAFPPASLDIDAADEADLARWFKNDDDFRAWLDAHAAWKEEVAEAEKAGERASGVETASTDLPGHAEDNASIDVDALVITRPNSAEPEEHAGVVGKPWVAPCLALDERTREILLETSPFRPGGPRSLADVAGDLSLSREAVRRIRIRAASNLFARNAVVDDAVHRLALLLRQGVIEQRLFTSGFDPALEEAQVLASLGDAAQRFGKRNSGRSLKVWTETILGDVWFGTDVSPTSWFEQVFDAHNSIVNYEECEAAFHNHFDRSRPNLAAANWFAKYVDDCDELRIEGEFLVRSSGTLIEQVVVELTLRGEPMTTTEIQAKFDPERERSVEGAIINENLRGTRIVKTIDRRWALSSWDVAPYVTGVDLIAEIITEHGGHVGLRKLKREAAQRSTISPVSITMYATLHHRFVCEDDLVRLRSDDEPIATTPPERSGHLYRRVDAATPGCWSIVLDVEYAAIRAASTTLPAPFIALLGMSDGNPKSISCNNTEVEATINMSSVALSSSGGWRDVVTSLGAQDGDRVVFTALPTGDAAATLAPDLSSPSENVNLIRSLIGGDGANGLLEDFAYAVGVTETVDDEFIFEELDERLSRRGTPDIRAALVAIHPELEL